MVKVMNRMSGKHYVKKRKCKSVTDDSGINKIKIIKIRITVERDSKILLLQKCSYASNSKTVKK